MVSLLLALLGFSSLFICLFGSIVVYILVWNRAMHRCVIIESLHVLFKIILCL